jgi:hypothetical protein
MWQQGQVFKLKVEGRGRAAPLGVPVPARGAWLGEAAGGRVRGSQ